MKFIENVFWSWNTVILSLWKMYFMWILLSKYTKNTTQLLTILWRCFLSYATILLICWAMHWFLHDRDLCHERTKLKIKRKTKLKIKELKSDCQFYKCLLWHFKKLRASVLERKDQFAKPAMWAACRIQLVRNKVVYGYTEV